MRSVAHVQANQEAKLVSIMRTRSAQIGVQPATIDVQFDGQIGSLSKRRVGRENESKKKDSKVKGTKVRFS